jgi:hypothetical protein
MWVLWFPSIRTTRTVQIWRKDRNFKSETDNANRCAYMQTRTSVHKLICIHTNT